MKTFSSTSWSRQGSHGWRACGRLATALGASLVLLLGGVASTALADNGGNLGNGTLSTGEGEGTLPASRGRSGLVLLGELHLILNLVEGVSGDGNVTIRPLDPAAPAGTVVVFFEGDLEISLNRDALDDGRVAFGFFAGGRFADGLYQLSYGDVHFPVQRVDERAIALPLERAYDPDVTAPEALRLRVLNELMDRYALVIRPVGRGLRLIQRTNY